jgi:hypothetical protein
MIRTRTDTWPLRRAAASSGRIAPRSSPIPTVMREGLQSHERHSSGAKYGDHTLSDIARRHGEYSSDRSAFG